MTASLTRAIVILGIIGLMHIDFGRSSVSVPAPPTFATIAVAGGVSVASDKADTVFTASEDGKTIYMWQYYSSKPPKYLGQTEAILGE